MPQPFSLLRKAAEGTYSVGENYEIFRSWRSGSHGRRNDEE